MRPQASLAVFAALSTAATSDLLKRADCPAADAPVCETSSGSPDINDCQLWAGIGDNYAGGCAQPFGSGCQNDGSQESCDLVFCQDDGPEPICFDSDETHCIGEYVQSLIDTCGSDGKVGGYVHVPRGSNYINVELVHS